MAMIQNDGRPLLVEELAALPEEGFGRVEYEFTDDDRTRGYAEVNGARIEVKPGINSVNWPVWRVDNVVYAMGDGSTSYIDEIGARWLLGRYRTGGWFRYIG